MILPKFDSDFFSMFCDNVARLSDPFCLQSLAIITPKHGFLAHS